MRRTCVGMHYVMPELDLEVWLEGERVADDEYMESQGLFSLWLEVQSLQTCYTDFAWLSEKATFPHRPDARSQ